MIRHSTSEEETTMKSELLPTSKEVQLLSYGGYGNFDVVEKPIPKPGSGQVSNCMYKYSFITHLLLVLYSGWLKHGHVGTRASLSLLYG